MAQPSKVFILELNTFIYYQPPGGLQISISVIPYHGLTAEITPRASAHLKTDNLKSMFPVL